MVLRPDEFSAETVADSVSAVLRAPRFLEAAVRTADEIATMADPAEVATVVRAYHR